MYTRPYVHSTSNIIGSSTLPPSLRDKSPWSPSRCTATPRVMTEGGIPLSQHFGNMWYATVLKRLSAIPLVQQEATCSMRLCSMRQVAKC